jgi:preprotein translocase subunit SecA
MDSQTATTAPAPIPVLTAPSRDYRRTEFHVPRKLPKGLDARVDALVGRVKRRGSLLKELRAEAEQIDALGEPLRSLSDRHLRERLAEHHQQFLRQKTVSAETTRAALAAIREAAERVTGMRPFVVQLMGALALHRGFLAEMATGEGKTLTASLAAVLAGWSNRPCHVITVNDYLAQRDADWFKSLYAFCGLSVGCVTGAMDAAARKRGYDADVTYTTSKEIVADFLRDRIRLGALQHPSRRMIRTLLLPRTATANATIMRGLHTAIVDEADSVLIDEAVTPLIIAQPQDNAALREACAKGQQIAAKLAPDEDFRVNLRHREVELTERGRRKLETLRHELPPLWRGAVRSRELIEQALTARELFHREKHYVVQEGKVAIVDEFTGRIMVQRTWRQGLHQAIEAKEGLEITAPTETLGRLSFQRFFRFFRKISGMTGTAREGAAEFWQIYRLPVIAIPTNRPCIRVEHPTVAFADQQSKWDAVVAEIAAVHSTGRPILVGTRNVAASELLAQQLTERGLNFRLLNAVRNSEEAQIIAEAGQPSQITIATNMAGRGTDIKLGRGVAELGGLHVIATEPHESPRIDRQLIGRSARQGDAGSARKFCSADDELLIRFLAKPLRRSLARSLKKNPRTSSTLAQTAVAFAQAAAQRQAFKQRRNVLKADTWLEEALSFTGAGQL